MGIKFYNTDKRKHIRFDEKKQKNKDYIIDEDFEDFDLPADIKLRAKKSKPKAYNKEENRDLMVRMLSDEFVKKNFDIISNAKTNLYQKIYQLVKTNPEIWKQFHFLSSESKVENFIERLHQEVKLVQSEKFNFEKYKDAIKFILGIKETKKFPEPILKNMYIAKLQNICFLLQKQEEGNEISEVEEKTTSAYIG